MYKVPRQIIRTYDVGWLADHNRKKEEKQLFAQGYQILSEEESKKFSVWQVIFCICTVILIPLIPFTRVKKTRVVYEMNNTVLL